MASDAIRPNVSDGVKTGNTHCEQMLSALPLRTDIAQRGRHVRFVPIGDIIVDPVALKLRMQPRGEYRYGSAIRIVGGICNHLIIQGERGSLLKCDRIVELQNSFWPIIELTIADENSHAARRNERARRAPRLRGCRTFTYGGSTRFPPPKVNPLSFARVTERRREIVPLCTSTYL
jgi:hypothetical protein